MANILKKFTKIMNANVNSILDKMENPEKMMNQYITDMEEVVAKVDKIEKDIADVKMQTAGVMAEAKLIENRISVMESEISSYEDMIREALNKTDETAALVLTKKKIQLQDELSKLKEAKSVADDNVRKMREMYEKLTSDLSVLKLKRDTLKSKLSVIKVKDIVSDSGTKGTSAVNTAEEFKRLEEKIDKRLATADAIESLDLETDESAKYVAEYNKASMDKRIKEELERIRNLA